MARIKLADLHYRFITFTMEDGTVYDEVFVHDFETGGIDDNWNEMNPAIKFRDTEEKEFCIKLNDITRIHFLDTVESQVLFTMDYLIPVYEKLKDTNDVAMEAYDRCVNRREELLSQGHTKYQRKNK